MRRFAKRFFAAVAALILLVIALALVIIAKPEIILTSSVAEKLVALALEDSYAPTWKTFQFRIESRSFLRKRVLLRIDNLCLGSSESSIEGCFEIIDLDLTFTLPIFRSFRIDALSRIRLEGRDLTVRSSSEEEEAPAETGRLEIPVNFDVSTFELSARPEDFLVRLPEIALYTDGKLHRRAQVFFAPAPSGLKLDFDVLASAGDTLVEEAAGSLVIRSDLFDAKTFTFLEMTGEVRHFDDELRPSLRVDFEPGHIESFTIDTFARLAGRSLIVRGEGHFDERAWRIEIDGTVLESWGAVDLRDAVFLLGAEETSYTLERFSTTVPFEVFFKTEDIHPFLKDKGLMGSLELLGQLNQEREKTRAVIDADLEMEPRDSLGVVCLCGTRLKLEDARDPGATAEFENLEVRFSLENFAALVPYVSKTPYAIPAPFNQLNGGIDARIAKEAGKGNGPYSFVFELNTDLHSTLQSIVVEGKGELKTSSLSGLENAALTGEVILRDVSLEMPFIDVSGIPQVKMDPRILASPEQKQEAAEEADPESQRGEMEVDMRIHTAENPVRIYPGPDEEPIPVALDLGFSPFHGEIQVQTFDVEFFRRKATIERFLLTRHEGSSLFDLDGLVLYNTADAKVEIRILGNLDKPQLSFSSEPPMEEEEIIGLLIYGKMPSDLDPDESTSAGNMQTAVAGGAFGLASLYLFASTPVEYVGFDPVTQSYSVKVRLPSGASAEVGRSEVEESQYLVVRKRLGSHWAIETEIREEEQTSVTTFLEWFNRF